MQPTSTPLVSVVTPTFRCARFIEDAIRSVLSQDYPRIEYIVVDGGDDVETPKIIERYSSRIAAYIREPDGGQSAAINKGLRLAQGEIVAWLNADDMYLPGAVSAAVAAFQAGPGAALFYGDAVFCDEHGRFLRYFTEVEPHQPRRLLTQADYICQPTVFMRRSALDRVGLLDEGLHYVMDWDLWCRFALAGGAFHYERRPIAVNREHGDTKTRRGAWRRLREIYKLQRRYGSWWWPRGFFNHTLWELDKDFGVGTTLPRVVKACVRGARRVKRRLAPRRGGAVPPLYGLLHHDPGVLARAEVHVPLCGRQAGTLRIVAEFPLPGHEQEVEVLCDGRPLARLRLPGGQGPQSREIDLSGRGLEQAACFEFHAPEAFQRQGLPVAWLLHSLEVV